MSWINSNLTLLFPRATARPHRGTRAPATRAEPSPHRDRVRAPRLARSNRPWPANTCLRGPRARAPDLRGHAVAQVLPDAVSFRVPRCRQFHRYQATKKPGTFFGGPGFCSGRRRYALRIVPLEVCPSRLAYAVDAAHALRRCRKASDPARAGQRGRGSGPACLESVVVRADRHAVLFG